MSGQEEVGASTELRWARAPRGAGVQGEEVAVEEKGIQGPVQGN